MKMRIS